MKKFFAIIAVAAFMTACGDNKTTETTPVDSASKMSTEAEKTMDSAMNNVNQTIDTMKKNMDTAASKMEKMADTMKAAADKMAH